jgi:hypothetical protein
MRGTPEALHPGFKRLKCEADNIKNTWSENTVMEWCLDTGATLSDSISKHPLVEYLGPVV